MLSVEELLPVKVRRRMIARRRVIQPNKPLGKVLGNLLRRDENLGMPPLPLVPVSVRARNQVTDPNVARRVCIRECRKATSA